MSAEPTFGRYAEIPLDQMTPQLREGYDRVVESRGEAPGPYKIFIQNPALMHVVVPVGVYFNKAHSSLSDAEREIAVNLINEHWLAAYSNHEHEIIGEQAGLAEGFPVKQQRQALPCRQLSGRVLLFQAVAAAPEIKPLLNAGQIANSLLDDCFHGLESLL